MYSFIKYVFPAFFLVSCSHTLIQNNTSKDKSFDDLYEKTPADSPFARPTKGNIGFDVDGVLHSDVRYSSEGDYNDPTRPIFQTTGRNKRLQKEIELLLQNGNKPFVVTHNYTFCSPSSFPARQKFLAENNLEQIQNNEIFCITPPIGKSIQLTKSNIDTFYDDSPKVLAEVSRNKPNTKLFMVLPKQEKVAHYFSSANPDRVGTCGVLLVDDTKPKKRFLLQLHLEQQKESWAIPKGSCAFTENKNKNCALGECEDPITGSIRVFNEKTGQNHKFDQDLNQTTRLMVLHSKNTMLLVAKFADGYLNQRSFIPEVKHASEVSNKVFNILNSPGYRWFDLDECKSESKIEGYPVDAAKNTCKEFYNYLNKM